MSQERVILRGRHQEAKNKRMDLEARISANLRAARLLLADVGLQPLERIDLDGCVVQLTEAQALMIELRETRALMAEIEDRIDG